MQAKHNGPEIARQLGLSRSTINREINRSKALPIALASDYQAGIAQQRSQAQRRAGGAARRKLGSDLESPLWRTVLTGLRSRWSPQQIAGKLPRMNKAAIKAGQALPTQPVSVSHETIYCAIYAMPRNTLRTELVGLLRKRHKTRLPRARGSARKGGLPNMTNISLRPPEVAARIVPGHWEGDLIKGAMNRSSVGTLVERISRYTMLVKLDGNTAQDVLEGFKRRLKSIPESLALDHDLRPGLGDGAARNLERRPVDRHLLLRPAQPVAARLQRERQRLGARVPAQGHGPQPGQPSATHPYRAPAQQPPA